MTAADQIKQHLKARHEWVAKNELCRLELRTKRGGLHGPEVIGRTLRLKEEAKEIAVKYIDGHGVYRYLPDYVRHLYIPTSVRSKDMWTDLDELNRLLNTYGTPHRKTE